MFNLRRIDMYRKVPIDRWLSENLLKQMTEREYQAFIRRFHTKEEEENWLREFDNGVPRQKRTLDSPETKGGDAIPEIF